MNRCRFFISLFLAVCLLTGMLSVLPVHAEAMNSYSRVRLDIFDTFISLKGFAPSQAAFDAAADQVFSMLTEYDQVFDAYHGYDGLHNLYYVNLHAKEAPVSVPEELFDLLWWCRERWLEGMRTTNIAMGAVLQIWHSYRITGLDDPDNAQLPPMDALTDAAAHVDFEQVILDPETHTVYFADPSIQLDIGAVAKGYAADAAAVLLYREMPSFLLSLGGNVYAGEAPLDGRSAWSVGVQDPENPAMLMDIVDVSNRTVVTSGDYQRYYTVDGKRYHHIIDLATLMPSDQMISVTIVCGNSTLADFLSTTLFILPYEEGRALADQLEDVEVLWMLKDGTVQSTPGMARYARSMQ